jgi:hypothetical protein
MIANYNQLTIKKFLNCKRISEWEADPIDRNVRLLAEITGKEVDEVESMPITELKQELQKLGAIETLVPEAKVKMKFKVKGKRFTCIWEQQYLTAAQYIDVCHFTKNQEDIIYNIHNILAAICVERTWYGKKLKYDGSKHKEIADLFYNHMTIEQAYPIMLFFCKFYEELETNIATYLLEEANNLKKEAQQIFGKSTVG